MLADSAWLRWPVIGWLITCRHLRAVRVKLQVRVRLRSGQALPYATPGFPVKLSDAGELHAAFCESRIRWVGQYRDLGNPDPLQLMTKFRAVAHFGRSGGGWTESSQP